MIRLPEDISANDVHQWLNSGYMYVDTDAGRKVCSYYDVAEEGREVRVMSIDGGGIFSVPVSAVYVHWPYCGALNYQNFAVLLTRHQQRQYRRTYNARQLSLTIPRKWEAMKMYGDTINDLSPNTPALVREAFSPTYMAFSEALTQIETGQAFSRAINPHVIIVGAKGSLLVYYKGEYVAVINADGKLLPVSADTKTLRRLLKYFEGRVVL